MRNIGSKKLRLVFVQLDECEKFAKALKNNEILIEDRISKGESNIVENNVNLYNQLNYENYFQVIIRVFDNS